MICSTCQKTHIAGRRIGNRCRRLVDNDAGFAVHVRPCWLGNWHDWVDCHPQQPLCDCFLVQDTLLLQTLTSII